MLWSVFSLLLVAAARGDLWLDEIWSLGFALDADSAADIFCRFKHDNNHVLNTLYLYFVRDTGDFLVFRTLSILAGMVSLWLLTHIAQSEWGEGEAMLVLLFAGSAFPLLLYFSEARGYALAICLSLLAFITLRKFLESLSKTSLFMFWLVSCAGILAHATFLMVCLALAFASVADSSTNSPIRSRLYRLLPHLPVFGFIAWWYNFYLIDMEIGGGPIFSGGKILGQTAAFLLGFPDMAAGHAVAAMIFLVLLTTGLIRLYQTTGRWLFFSGIFIFAPLAMLIASRPQFLYFRYFVVCFPYFYLFLAFLTADLWRRYPKARLLLVILLAVILTGHWQRNFELLSYGRGNYSAVVTKMLAESHEQNVLVGSDHDFRNQLLLHYYALRSKDGNRLVYVPTSDWQKNPPEWFIGHRPAPAARPLESRKIEGVGKFILADSWPSVEVSGWYWYLYRHEK